MKNGDHIIGLFQGMFKNNIMTFNPGWDKNDNKLDSFTNVRDLQRKLKAQGFKFENEVDESTAGSANFMVIDPDGNQILIDQNV